MTTEARQCAFLAVFRPIFGCIQPLLGYVSVQVTATKLAWTLGRAPGNFLLFSGEICSSLVTEF
jgi:hypothetical protein